MESIKSAFYDPAIGFTGAAKLAKRLKMPIAQVRSVLDQEYTVQVHKPLKKPKRFATIVAPYPGWLCIDLLDVHQTKSSNDGIAWLLVVVDIHSRFAWVAGLTNKKAATVTAGMKSIFKSPNMFFEPWHITSDKGSEFINSDFQKLLKKHRVKHIVVNPEVSRKNAIAESFNRGLRMMIERYIDAYDTLRYIDVLPDLIKNYNTREHGSIQAIPILVLKGLRESKQKVYHETYLKIGDTVRKPVKRGIFTKGTKPKWSSGLYTVAERHKYSVSLKSESGDMLGTRFKDNELQFVKSVERPQLKKPPRVRKTEAVLRTRAKTARVLKAEDIDPARILDQPRRRKPKLDDDYVDFESESE